MQMFWMQLTIVTLEGREVKAGCYNFKNNLWKQIQCYNFIFKRGRKIPAAVPVEVKLTSEEAELHLQQQVFSKREAASWSGTSRMVGWGPKRADCTLLRVQHACKDLWIFAPSHLILLSIPPYLSLSQLLASHLLLSLPMWKAGRKVLGRRGQRHLDSLITAFQSLRGKVRKKKWGKKEMEGKVMGICSNFPIPTNLPRYGSPQKLQLLFHLFIYGQALPSFSL